MRADGEKKKNVSSHKPHCDVIELPNVDIKF